MYVGASPTGLRAFVTLEVSTAASGTGNGISLIVFPWLALELTGSPTAAGAMAAIAALPMLLSFLFSGVLVDMFGRRRVAFIADLLSMVSVAMVPIFALAFGLTYAMLAAFAVLGAVFDPAGISARESMLPETAQAAGMPLERANGIHESIWGVAFIAGPGLGGVLVATVGGVTACWVAAGFLAFSAATIAAIRVSGAGRPLESERPRGVWRSTKEGISFVFSDPLLRTVTIVSAVVTGFWLPIEGVVLPVYFQGIDAPEQLGLTIMALSLGAIGGALTYGAFGQRFARRTVFIAALILASVGIIGLSLLPGFGWFVGLAFVTGLAYGPVDPIINVVMQERSPSRLRGRVVGLITSAEYVAGPIGYAIAGPLIELTSLGTAFTFMAVGIAVTAVYTLSQRSLRLMDHV